MRDELRELRAELQRMFPTDMPPVPWTVAEIDRMIADRGTRKVYVLTYEDGDSDKGSILSVHASEKGAKAMEKTYMESPAAQGKTRYDPDQPFWDYDLRIEVLEVNP